MSLQSYHQSDKELSQAIYRPRLAAASSRHYTQKEWEEVRFLSVIDNRGKFLVEHRPSPSLFLFPAR